MKTMKEGALVLLACIISFSANAQKFNPVTKVTTGEVYNYSMETQTEIVQSIGEQEMNFQVAVTATIKDSVCSVFNNGNTEVIATFWDIATSTNAMGMDTVMRMEGMTGPHVKITYSSLGKVINREIMDESQQNISQYNMDYSTFQETLFLQFPEKSLNPGDKWTVESLDTMMQASLAGKVTVASVTEYTLGNKETIKGKDVYNITYVSNMELAGEGNIQGMAVALEGTGISSGTAIVNGSTGVIISNDSETEMDMTVAITGPQNMIIPMTQKVNVTVKLME